MNKYDVYTVFTFINKTEVNARNEKKAIKKIEDIAESTDLFLQKIPCIKKDYQIKEVKFIEKILNK